jgi:diguanylate cyclase (GGDEF)-like protein/PAS domain S-box-containing protein
MIIEHRTMSPLAANPASEGRYRAIVEAQSELITLASADGTLVYANPAYARYFGLKPSTMLGRSLFEQVLESDRAHTGRVLDEVLRTGESISTVNRVMAACGQEGWIEWTHGVQRDDGKLLLCVGRDITERLAQEQDLLNSDRFVRMITDNLPQRMAYVDRDLRYRFVNDAHCKRFDREREHILGRTRDELLEQPTPAPIRAHIDAVLGGASQRFEYDDVADGQSRRFDIQLIPDTGPDGRVRGYFYTAMDVTERGHAEQALRNLTAEAQRQSDILRLVTEAIPSGVVVVGADGRYRFVNGAFERYCGLTRDHIVGRTAVEVLGEDEVARRRPFMARALSGESVTFALEYAGQDGESWLQLTCIPLRLSGGEVDGFVGISEDITQQRRERARLTELSQRDPLTSLLNRAGFEACLERQIRRGAGASLGLLYIDLDRFKAVNDLHGHPAGDRLLQLVAQRLTALVRGSDALARLGGDEFAILLTEVGTRANAETVAKKVVAAIGASFDVDGLTLQIGASVGVAFGVSLQDGWRELIQHADRMLYRAKTEGRGRHAA